MVGGKRSRDDVDSENGSSPEHKHIAIEGPVGLPVTSDIAFHAGGNSLEAVEGGTVVNNVVESTNTLSIIENVNMEGKLGNGVNSGINSDATFYHASAVAPGTEGTDGGDISHLQASSENRTIPVSNVEVKIETVGSMDVEMRNNDARRSSFDASNNEQKLNIQSVFGNDSLSMNNNGQSLNPGSIIASNFIVNAGSQNSLVGAPPALSGAESADMPSAGGFPVNASMNNMSQPSLAPSTPNLAVAGGGDSVSKVSPGSSTPGGARPAVPTAARQTTNKLKVEDALEYLELVKRQFADQPQVYNRFLDIMKDFKSQNIDTPGVIKRVKELFKGHIRLILEFNTFLPPGYKIELSPSERAQMEREEAIRKDAEARNIKPSQQPVQPRQRQKKPSQKRSQPVPMAGLPGSQQMKGLGGGSSPQSLQAQQHLQHQHMMQQQQLQLQHQQLQMQQQQQQQQQQHQQQQGGSVSHKQEEYDHAINYVKKIKTRFVSEPSVYKEFLDILHTYQKEQRTISDVFEKVSKLFAYHQDLLDEFARFLPNPAQPQSGKKISKRKEKERLKSKKKSDKDRAVDPIAITSDNGPEFMLIKQKSRKRKPDDGFDVKSTEEYQFLRKLKSQIGNRIVWDMLLKLIDMFNKEILNAPELMILVKSMFGKNVGLCDGFVRYFRQITGCSPEELKPQIPDGYVKVATTPRSGGKDVSHCGSPSPEPAGPSYMYVGSKTAGAYCSGRDSLGDEVLNDKWVLAPSGSENQIGKKNSYEEMLFKADDERFQLDMIIEVTTSAISALEPMAEELESVSRTDKSRYELDPDLSPLHLKAIERVYGTSGKEILELLVKSPAASIPVVLERMKQKDAEWRSLRREMDKFWRESFAKYYHKSLDHLSFHFKTNEKKDLVNKSLLTTIKSGPLSFEFKDVTVFDDLQRILIVTSKDTLSEKDDQRFVHFWTTYMAPAFGLKSHVAAVPIKGLQQKNSNENSDNEKSGDSLNGPNNAGDNVGDVDMMDVELKNEKAPVLVPSNSSTIDVVTDTDISYFDNDVADGSQWLASDKSLVFYGNSNFYLFIRIIQVLYERLYEAKKLSRSETLKKEELIGIRERSVPASRAASETPAVNIDDSNSKIGDLSSSFYTKNYWAFVRLLCDAMSGSMETVKYESGCRMLLGSSSYFLLTLDKILSRSVKEGITALNSDTVVESMETFIEMLSQSSFDDGYTRRVIECYGNDACYEFRWEVIDDKRRLSLRFLSSAEKDRILGVERDEMDAAARDEANAAHDAANDMEDVDDDVKSSRSRSRSPPPAPVSLSTRDVSPRQSRSPRPSRR